MKCGACGRAVYLAKDRLIGIIAGHWIALGLSRGRDRAAAYWALRRQQHCELVSAAVRTNGSPYQALRALLHSGTSSGCKEFYETRTA